MAAQSRQSRALFSTDTPTTEGKHCMIKLIASDLDGTLIGHDFRFRPRTLRALEAARAAGIDIVFVTGRPSRWLTPLRE